MNLTAIAIIAIIAWAVVSIVETTKDKKKKQQESKNSGELQNQIAQLKERIEVLEKIVTDENYDLKKQFSNLDKDKVA
ncbi:hypothetical protein CA267_013990 [Alteromonas pelagimontana]|uniref:Uncharacterized protein n=1 Tax=Alteromonas pelagimontana TaxID=1858656 RepID=A0A6M4MGP6_9ALTE|nr:hypothetical protein [Alteromonas pelagimontana]QJR81790.1 hypothetical protein CA267_013990 [Alteromonas pelagimontana]